MREKLLIVVSLGLALSGPSDAGRKPLIQGDPLVRLLSKDGIRSIDKPKMVKAADADRRVGDWEPVLGVREGDHSRAYPLRLLDAHEIVNDRLGQLPIAATW